MGSRHVALVLRRLDLVAYLAFGWVLIATGAVIVAAVFVTLSDHIPLHTALNRLQNGDLMRTYFTVANIPMTLASLAIAIGWMRLVMLNETPAPALGLRMPSGSARYFVKNIQLALGFLLFALPGVLLAAGTALLIGGDPGNIVAAVIAAISLGIAAWACLRFWLVFPAIAVGNDGMTFLRSYGLMRGKVAPLLVGTLVCWLPLLLVAAAFQLVLAAIYGEEVSAIGAIAYEFVSNFAILITTAASAGVMADIYAEAVPGDRQTAT